MGRAKKSRRSAVAPAAQAGLGDMGMQHMMAAAAVAHGAPVMPDDDGEEDEDAAEFRREAAELLKQKQLSTALPEGMQPRQLENAVAHLHQQTGISKAEAEEALLSTAEEHWKNFECWVNEALVWLAVQAETQDEASKLKEAMQVSLQEQQAAREAEAVAAPPLANRSEQWLRRKFSESLVLCCLDTLLPGSVLFSDRAPLRENIKHKLVELLRLEANCLKWYPLDGTHKYFKNLGEKFVHDLTELSTRSSSTNITWMAEPAAQQQQQHSVDSPHDAQQQGRSVGKAADAGLQGAVAAAAAAAGVGAALLCERRESPTPTWGSDDSTVAKAGSSGVRASTRKRQPPARYRSPTPVSRGSRSNKRQQQDQPSSSRPAKRPSPSEPKGQSPAGDRESPAAEPSAAAAAAAAAPCGEAGLQLQHNQQQQQLVLGVGGGGDAVQPAVVDGLSRMLDEEVQNLNHHVYTMPDVAGAVPVIFKTAEQLEQEQAAAADGSDSDVELVEEVPPSFGAGTSKPSRSLPSATAIPPGTGVAAAAAAAGMASSSLEYARQMQAAGVEYYGDFDDDSDY